MCQIAAAIPAKIYQENVMVKPEMHCACRQAVETTKVAHSCGLPHLVG